MDTNQSKELYKKKSYTKRQRLNEQHNRITICKIPCTRLLI